MMYVDKHGIEIVDGATVIYNGHEYTARDDPKGTERMYLQPGAWAPDDLRPIPMEHIPVEMRELLQPDMDEAEEDGT